MPSSQDVICSFLDGIQPAGEAPYKGASAKAARWLMAEFLKVGIRGDRPSTHLII